MSNSEESLALKKLIGSASDEVVREALAFVIEQLAPFEEKTVEEVAERALERADQRNMQGTGVMGYYFD